MTTQSSDEDLTMSRNDEDETPVEDYDADTPDSPLEHTTSHAKEIWRFRMRPPDDDEPEDWWFASTAIPLLAATTGPLANVLSIAALVVFWRETYDVANPGVDELAMGYPDPTWCTVLNSASLVCGCAGNLFLLFNFTRFVRYIYALPLTIMLWFLASAILISITTCMHFYTPPHWPEETYSQGFWHAIIAAVLYLISALLLMVNMLGYSLGHYTQHFELTDEQRNLILQTMMFFFWLAAGGGVFCRVCGWSYVDALYFCDVTVLTVGFGDFVAPNDVGRGLVFPYSVGGIIMLGLMVSSIRKFAMELSHDKIVRNHVERRRVRTMERSVVSSFEVEQIAAHETAVAHALSSQGVRPVISAPFDPQKRTIAFDEALNQEAQSDSPTPPGASSNKRKKFTKNSAGALSPLKRTVTWASAKMNAPPSKGLQKIDSHTGRLVVLKEEKDRFMAMRAIQYSTRRFKRYFALSMSVIAFSLLWCVGAAVFFACEHRTQGMTYFQGLYFCYVSLLTIGYGDFAPKSNAGKPFFVVWSLIAVPTMTILISDMSDTVVAAYKRGTFTLAAWTILPSKGFFREFLDSHPSILKAHRRLGSYARNRQKKKRIEKGFQVGPDPMTMAAAEEGEGDDPGDGPTLEELAQEETDEHDLARRLALAIRRTADHLKEDSDRRYTYEEWVEYTRLIRFSDYDESEWSDEEAHEEVDKGIIDWDWIGPNSPMMADQSEAEWVLDRLCESLDRYMRKQLPTHIRQRHKEQEAEILRKRSTPAQPDSPTSVKDNSLLSPASAMASKPTSKPSSPTATKFPQPGVPDETTSSGPLASQTSFPAQSQRRDSSGGLGFLTSAGRGRPFTRRASSSLGGSLGLLADSQEQGPWGLSYRRRSSASGGGGSRRTSSAARKDSATGAERSDSKSAARRKSADKPPPFSLRPPARDEAQQGPRSAENDASPEAETTPTYRDPFAASSPKADAEMTGPSNRGRSSESRLRDLGHTIDTTLEEADEPPEAAWESST